MKDIKALEDKNIRLTKREAHRKWRNIAQALSDLNLTVNDLDPLVSDKPKIAMEICRKNNVTMGEMVLLRQYLRAIEEGDTRAAEFIRDTMGENPKQVVEVQKSALSQMSEAEIEEALEELKKVTPTPVDEGTPNQD